MADGVQIIGLRETVRSLEKFGVEVSDLKTAFRRVGQVVVNEARVIAPVLTGRLAGSIRPSNTKNKAVVRAGGAAIPYAGVIHFGGYQGIVAQPFLTDALEATQPVALRVMDDELRGLIRGLGLA